MKILLLVVILLGLFAIVDAFIKPVSPETIANNFIVDVLNNQPSQAYQLTSSDFRSITTASELQNAINSVDGLCSGTPKLNSTKLYGSAANYTFSTNGINSSTCTILVELSEKSGKWYVDYFNQY